jgi:hypothetical protein
VSATTALPPDVDAYLAAVRAALTDLPAAERDDLVAEVEASLLDAASEGGPIAARLGPPEEFAAELRSAAGLVLDGVTVDNVYPYARDGALLHDVQLFDGSGRPLDVRRDVDEPDRRVPASVTGTLLWNVFPIRYFEPATNVVADPNAAPPLSAPRLKTPSLESGSTP